MAEPHLPLTAPKVPLASLLAPQAAPQHLRSSPLGALSLHPTTRATGRTQRVQLLARTSSQKVPSLHFALGLQQQAQQAHHHLAAIRPEFQPLAGACLQPARSLWPVPKVTGFPAFNLAPAKFPLCLVLCSRHRLLARPPLHHPSAGQPPTPPLGVCLWALVLHLAAHIPTQWASQPGGRHRALPSGPDLPSCNRSLQGLHTWSGREVALPDCNLLCTCVHALVSEAMPAMEPSQVQDPN